MPSLDKQFYIALGKVLRHQREELGLSLQDVVDKLPKDQKVVKQTLSKYEKGERRIDTIIFNSICKILKLNAIEVLNSIKFE